MIESKALQRFWLVLGILGLFVVAACGGDDPQDGGQTSLGEIYGVVTLEGVDDYSGVEVRAGEESTTTDESGAFELSDLATGETVAQASFEGYRTQEETVEVSSDEAVEVNFVLELANQPPVIEDLTLEPEVLVPDEVALLIVDASDPDGGELTYAFEATEGFGVDESDEEGQAQVTAPAEFGVVGEITVTVTDDQGASDSASIQIETRENSDPVIESISALPQAVAPGGVVALEVQATDPDGDELSYEWTAPAEWEFDVADEAQVELTAPELPGETAIIEVVVSDEFGAQASTEVTVDTEPNHAPEILEISATPPQTAPGGEIELSVVAEDPNGGELTYEWTAPAGWTLSDTDESWTTVEAPQEFEASAQIFVTVTDEYDESASAFVIVSTFANQGPQISTITADPSEVFRGEMIALNVEASHPQNSPLDYTWDAPAGWTLDEDPSAPESPMVIAPNEPGQNASIVVTITDAEGATATASVSVRTQTNLPPTIHSFTSDSYSLPRGGEASVVVDASDPDGGPLSYSWAIDNPDWALSETGTEAAITAPATPNQSATITVEVEDGFGASVSASLSLETATNLAPIIVDLSIDNAGAFESGETLMASAFAVDPEDDAFTYEWSINNSDWTVDEEGVNTTIEAPSEAFSFAVLTLTVTDEWGASATETQRVHTEKTFPTLGSCGRSGRFGPSQTQCDSAYAGFDDVTIDVDAGIQMWTVPQTGTYRIHTLGAQGAGTGGYGASIAGDFDLEEGDELRILVGQKPLSSDGLKEAGGGGGTFVVLVDSDSSDEMFDGVTVSPLIIAGGGAGSGNRDNTPFDWMHGQSGTAGEDAQHVGGAGGDNGHGGEAADNEGAGGGGYLTDGEDVSSNFRGGKSFLNGGVGGNTIDLFSNAPGGFGGGGGTLDAPAGGGGYSGGGGGNWGGSGPNDGPAHFGGGGGSFNAGANPNAEAAINQGHGQVEIEIIDW